MNSATKTSSKNKASWDERAREGARHTKQVHDVHLTNPLPILDPEGWLEGGLQGRRILCLASGGGLQSALCAAAGAIVTVVDLSSKMLDQDRQVSAKHRFNIQIIQADMRDLNMLAASNFDFVLQPVSTCYVPEVRSVFREVSRVLKPGGIYVSQHKQPANQQVSALPGRDGYFFVTHLSTPGPLPELLGEWRHRETDCIEYLHSWEDLLGGMCASGFSIEGLREPNFADVQATPGSFEHRSSYVPPFVKVKARKRGDSVVNEPRIWIR